MFIAYSQIDIVGLQYNVKTLIQLSTKILCSRCFDLQFHAITWWNVDLTAHNNAMTNITIMTMTTMMMIMTHVWLSRKKTWEMCKLYDCGDISSDRQLSAGRQGRVRPSWRTASCWDRARRVSLWRHRRWASRRRATCCLALRSTSALYCASDGRPLCSHTP